jgi:hypothetical protein
LLKVISAAEALAKNNMKISVAKNVNSNGFFILDVLKCYNFPVKTVYKLFDCLVYNYVLEVFKKLIILHNKI